MKDCALKRNMSNLVEHPKDKSLSYLKEHLKSCPICHQQYEKDLGKKRTLESWVPNAKPPLKFSKEIGKMLPSFSKECSLILEDKASRKKFLIACVKDFLSIFQNKYYVFTMLFFLFFYYLLN